MTQLAEQRQTTNDRELANQLRLDAHRLARLSANLARRFREADPFPHIAIDGLFDDALLRRVVAEIPPLESELWRVWGSGEPTDFEQPLSLKRGICEEALMGPLTCAFLHSLNSITFLKFLEGLAGITGLVTDPTFSGGGLHCTGRGARLLVHVDRDRHPLGNPFNQMINCILYLNEDWDESYGGHIELWSRDGKRRVQRIAPFFNRLVIFQSGSTSFHGHPEPLACPPGRARLSIATYYYVMNRAPSADYTGHMDKIQWVNPAAR